MSRHLWRHIVAALVVSRLAMAAGILLAIHGGPAHAAGGLDAIFNSWDGKAYIRIADHGYSTQPLPEFVARLTEGGYSMRLNPDDAFLPLYPLLVRCVSALTGDYVTAGLLVSLLAEAAALFYVYRLVAAVRDDGAGLFALWATALAPLGLFLGAVYTESLFIAAAAAALYHMERGEVGAAAAATVIAAATRITAVALIVALAMSITALWWRRRNDGGDGPPVTAAAMLRHVLLVAVTPVPLLAFAFYMRAHTGDGLALIHANTVYFGHEFASPIAGFTLTLSSYRGYFATANPYTFAFAREIVFGVLGVVAAAAAWVWPRFPKPWAAYCTVVVLSAICISFWRSVPRYELALFPMLVMAADVTHRAAWTRIPLVAAGGALLAWGANIYAQGWLA